MKTVARVLLWVIIPLVVLYLAFTYLGTAGGVIVAVLYLAVLNLPVIFNSLAGQAYNRGEFEKALKMLERALKANPKNSGIRGSYAWLLLKLGHTREAEKQIDQAIADANRDDIRNPLNGTKALVHWKKGELDQAISLMEKTMESFKNTNTYGTLGFLYIEKGDLDRALSFNLEAYDYNNTDPIILDNLGCTRLLRGEYEEAREIYQQLMKLKPHFPEAFYNYARVLAHFGELDDALYMCRTALSLKFWNTSTITREQVEAALKELEAAKEKKTKETTEADSQKEKREKAPEEQEAAQQAKSVDSNVDINSKE